VAGEVWGERFKAQGCSVLGGSACNGLTKRVRFDITLIKVLQGPCTTRYLGGGEGNMQGLLVIITVKNKKKKKKSLKVPPEKTWG